MAVIMSNIGGIQIPIWEPSAAPAVMAMDPGAVYCAQERELARPVAAVQWEMNTINYEIRGMRGCDL